MPITSNYGPFAYNGAKVLLSPGTSYALTTTSSSANQALTAGIKAITIYARNADAYIQIGSGAQTASSSSMYVGSGERIDLDASQYASPNIAVIYGPGAAAAVLQVTELS